MPVFLDTRGRTKIAIGICGRCSRKFPYTDLVEDPNYPGLYVCPEDRDQLDPWRLPARESEDISLEHPRPDVSLSVGPQAVPIEQPNYGYGPVTRLNPSHPWSPLQAYTIGDQVTPQIAIGLVPAGKAIQLTFTCVKPGVTGASAPAWPNTNGASVADGTVLWVANGIFMP